MAAARFPAVAGGVVLVASVVACAARAPSLPAPHPADPAASSGRLAGPPAILRAARPPAGATVPEPEAEHPPEHRHE
jgi:hypothetical protein